MLLIKIEGGSFWDEKNEEFVDIKGQTIRLEHSLVSISKWEAKWHKPFLSPEKKTQEETIDYIRFMTITQNVDPALYRAISNAQVDAVNRYIEDPMSAKIFHKQEGQGHVYRTITSDDIYYSMVAYNIPFDCEKWHLNRLLTLIQLCDEHNRPGKKMPKNEYAQFRSKLNAARKAKRAVRG